LQSMHEIAITLGFQDGNGIDPKRSRQARRGAAIEVGEI
jgi:hypothetical protein